MQLLPDVSTSRPDTVSPSVQRDGAPEETVSGGEGERDDLEELIFNLKQHKTVCSKSTNLLVLFCRKTHLQ